MKRIDLVYFNAGGGHRAAAQALQEVIVEQQRPWQVRLIDLVQVLDPQGRFRRATGIAPEDLYNRRLARGWTLGLARELKLWQGLIRLTHGAMLRRLASHWRSSAPDLVVSLVPNFNRVLWHGVVQVRPWVPFVTVMTDLADLPPNFWIEPELPQQLVCGTPRAMEQARAAGCGEHRLHLCSGMILRQEFYRPLQIDRRAQRLALGLPAERPVGIVSFGGTGSTAMLDIVERLPDTPLILICGHNAALAARLSAAGPGAARRSGLHPRGPALHGPGRLVHRQARPRQPERGAASAVAGADRPQRLDPAAGALQRRLGARRGPGAGAGQLA